MWFLNLVTCRNFEFCYFLQLVFVYNAQVSTKSGLDPNGVWQAWGMASLKAGNLSGAREKFVRCLKTPVDRNQLKHGVRLLQEIVQHLESTVKPTEHGTATLRHRLDLIRSLTFLTQCFYIHCLLYRRLMRTSWPPCVSWRRLSLILLL